MSNLGLKLALGSLGITVKETAVGDRYVLEGMREGAYTLGGEQSGHVIFSDFATTGDGILTGLQLAAEIARSERPFDELASVMTRLPQALVNVEGVDKAIASSHPVIRNAVTKATNDLAGTGRVLLRPSGTEPLVRVTVEAAELGKAEDIASTIAAAVFRHACTERPTVSAFQRAGRTSLNGGLRLRDWSHVA